MYITRLAYNSQGWRRPTGDASKLESKASFNSRYGFGYEDWLFRSEWHIDGWRYGFVEGVNKSRKKLLAIGNPVDVVLFTVQPDKKRRYVARIRDAECLPDDMATAAFDAFKRKGWYSIMKQEVAKVGGDPGALDGTGLAPHVVNVRFRQESLEFFPPDSFVEPDSPVFRYNRYQLVNVDNLGRSGEGKGPGKGKRKGTSTLPKTDPYLRSVSARTVECTPEHAAMQKRLMLELKKEYPGATIIKEENGIDVVVTTHKEQILFEIKTELDPRMVIRLALGQILEYAYYEPTPDQRRVSLIIVGRRSLGSPEQAYLDHLREKFGLPIHYRQVPV